MLSIYRCCALHSSNNVQFQIPLSRVIIHFIAITKMACVVVGMNHPGIMKETSRLENRMLSFKSNNTASSSCALERRLRVTPRSKCRFIKRCLEFETYQTLLAFRHHCPVGRPHSIDDFTPRFHSSHITPADPARKKNSHTLSSAPWRAAEELISSGVPPPLPLFVDVDVLELEVELFVCDVLVEVSAGDAGTTVVPTTETLVVVGSGATVIGTTVVVEVVAAAWGLDDVEVEDVVAALGVEAGEVVIVVIILLLIVDVLVSPAAD